MNSLLAWVCLSAELSWLALPAARKHFMETNIWWKHSMSPKTARALKTIFFAMAANHIFPNQITMKVNQRSPTFVALLTLGYNFEVERSFRVFEKKIFFLVTENSIGTEGNL